MGCPAWGDPTNRPWQLLLADRDQPQPLSCGVRQSQSPTPRSPWAGCAQFEAGGLAWPTELGSHLSPPRARGWAGGARSVRSAQGCAVPQEEHAEEQAGGHGQEEVQHGSQEGIGVWHRAPGSKGSAAALPPHAPGAPWLSRAFRTAAGYPVPDRERLAEEHVRGHRAVPLQGGGPQQDGHRGLPGREVRGASGSSGMWQPLGFSGQPPAQSQRAGEGTTGRTWSLGWLQHQ